MDAKETAKIFKALCDENRVEILTLLKSGEKCACNIGDTLGLAQSKLSYHMKILCDSGLVESWYIGKWTHYQINISGIEKASSILKNFSLIDDSALCDTCKEAV